MPRAFIALLTLAAASAADWPNYGGDKGGARYSPLKQIDRSNVSNLRVAWIYHTGEDLKRKEPMECTPIIVDGVLYATTARSRVVALDAATGAEIWSFNPHAN